MSIRTMGLDVATHTGLVVLDEGPKLLHEEELYFPKLRGVERCGAMAKSLMVTLDKFKPDMVLFEGYAYAAKGAPIVQAEITGVLKYFLTQLKYEFVEVAPSLLKRFVTGRGNAGKDEMMMHVFKRWKHESKSNNTADAYGLAAFGLGLHATIPLIKPQLEAIKRFRQETS